MQTQTRSGNPALQNGLLFGVILGIIEAVLSFLLGNVGFLISLIIYLGLVGFAGYRASARTGKVGTGLLAGFLAGLFSSVIASAALLIYSLANIDSLRQLLQQNANTFNQGFVYTNDVVAGFLVLFLVILILASSALALGIGAIGGAIGKGKVPVPPVPPYPYPYPYPGPVYMPPPAYPPQEFIPPQDYTPPPPQQ